MVSALTAQLIGSVSVCTVHMSAAWQSIGQCRATRDKIGGASEHAKRFLNRGINLNKDGPIESAVCHYGAAN